MKKQVVSYQARKNGLGLGAIMLAMMLTSCSSSRFYQVFNTASKDAAESNGAHVYVNDEVKITYDFWSNGGQMNFTLENKTNSAIYIDWNRSHLIHNGMAYEYWTDSEAATSILESASSGVTQATMAIQTGLGSTSGNSSIFSQGRKSTVSSSVRYRTKPVLHVPPRSSIQFARFQLLGEGIYDCKFNWAEVSDGEEQTYEPDTSPLVFRNYLNYSTDPSFAKLNVVDNEFYLRSVAFVKMKTFLGESSFVNYCNIHGLEGAVVNYQRPYKKGTDFFLRFR
jgi:hypothetical protein